MLISPATEERRRVRRLNLSFHSGRSDERITMPTYVYRCDECGHEVDCIHSIEDRDTPHYCNCHRDDRPAMRRKLNAAAPIFKGSGFYTTDKGKS
jgi:putative FmdB family regulatory protein